jgi:hypothetical protein
MMFTGTHIEDLIATVERVEARMQDNKPAEIEPCLLEASLLEPGILEPGILEPGILEPGPVEPWIASAQETTDYDSKLLGVA